MEEEAFNQIKDSGPCSKNPSRCLFCDECVQEEEKVLLSKSKELNREVLNSQLSTFFMLRKVLGLSAEFLESLLVNCGSPVEWRIKLCRMCKRLLKEAEFLWERMKQLRRDYEKVTLEVKDMLINSISLEEAGDLSKWEKEDKENKMKIAVEEKLKSSMIVEGIRLKFFMDLQDEEGDDSSSTRNDVQAPSLSPIIGSARRVNSSGMPSRVVTWSENGVPYLTLANLERKLNDLVETVTSVQETVLVSHANQPESVGSEERDEVGQTLAISQKESTSSTPKDNSTISTATNASEPILQPEVVVKIDPDDDEEESCLRIAESNSYLEQDDDFEDNDSVPHILGMLKVDFEEGVERINVMGVDNDDDPMTIDDDDPMGVDDDDPNDPDFVPDEDNQVDERPSLRKTMPPPQQVQPQAATEENQKFKFSSLKIKVVKQAEKEFDCSKCLAKFDSRLGCQIHILRDHYDEKVPFHCNFCYDKFGIFHSLREHIASAHGSQHTPYDDDFNPDSPFESDNPNPKDSDQGSSTRNDALNKHKCPLVKCSETFKTKRALEKHTSSVHGATVFSLTRQIEEASPDLKCEICAKRGIEYPALNKDILEIHYKKMHNGFQACVPAKIKTKIVHKASHVSTKFRSTEMKCPDCQKILPNADALAKHLMDPENKCPECSKHFMFETGMKNHLEMEHLQSKYYCPFCNKSFTSQIVLEKHIENHRNYDVHQCEICLVRVTGYSTLSRHVSLAHPETIQQQQTSQSQPPQEPQQNPEIFGL